MIVTINKHLAGTCVWCRKQTNEGVEVQFGDGLAGFLCWSDFKKAVKARSDDAVTDGDSLKPTTTVVDHET